jgi:hypothetical protein
MLASVGGTSSGLRPGLTISGLTILLMFILVKCYSGLRKPNTTLGLLWFWMHYAVAAAYAAFFQ